jgi:hypothetical protein
MATATVGQSVCPEESLQRAPRSPGKQSSKGGNTDVGTQGIEEILQQFTGLLVQLLRRTTCASNVGTTLTPVE